MRKTPLFLAICIAFYLTGCGSTKNTPVDVSYHPERQGALSSVASMTIALVVEDQRPPEEQTTLAKWRPSSIDPNFVFTSKDPVPDLVKKAVKDEFEFNGHRVIEGSQASDARIRIGLKKFSGIFTGRNRIAEIQAEVLVTRAGQDGSPAPFPVAGNYKKRLNPIIAVETSDPIAEAFNGALKDFIHNLTLDPRFVEALR